MALQTLNTIKSWFKTGLKPTQTQFWDTWDSFRHKDEKVPVKDVVGIDELLNPKADKAVLNEHLKDKNAHAPQVNTDWNSESGTSQLLNKPTFKTINGKEILGTGDLIIKEESSPNLQVTLENGAEATLGESNVKIMSSFKGNTVSSFRNQSGNQSAQIELRSDASTQILVQDDLKSSEISIVSNNIKLQAFDLNVNGKFGAGGIEFGLATISQIGNAKITVPQNPGIHTVAMTDDITLQKALETNAVANINTPLIINNSTAGSLTIDNNGIYLRSISPIPVSIGGNGDLFLSGAHGSQINMSNTMNIAANGLPLNISSDQLIKIAGTSGIEISEGSSSIKVKRNNLNIGDVGVNITSNFVTKVHGDGGLQLTSLSPVIVEAPAPVDIRSLYAPVTIKSEIAQVNLDAADCIDIVRGKLKITGIPMYNDNNDAISNDYEVDKVYKTPTGELRIVF